jgi:hypothetical protein
MMQSICQKHSALMCCSLVVLVKSSVMWISSAKQLDNRERNFFTVSYATALSQLRP